MVCLVKQMSRARNLAVFTLVKRLGCSHLRQIVTKDLHLHILCPVLPYLHRGYTFFLANTATAYICLINVIQKKTTLEVDFNVIWQECFYGLCFLMNNFWLTLTYFQGRYRSGAIVTGGASPPKKAPPLPLSQRGGGGKKYQMFPKNSKAQNVMKITPLTPVLFPMLW
jgi:hypothetical protein